MSYRYLGRLPFAQLVSKKKQRPKGGAKNAYYLGMFRSHYDTDPIMITNMLHNFGGVPQSSPNNYLFTKRANAEKAWAWFMLRYS